MSSFASWTDKEVADHNLKVAAGKFLAAVAPVIDTRVIITKDGTHKWEECETAKPTSRLVVINAEPVAAPRMTRRDKWLKPRRACVQKYFDYRDALRTAVGELPSVPDELHCRFYVSMPVSWSRHKRGQMLNEPHRGRPDRDNFDKAVCDALFPEDGAIWKGSQEKFWAIKGQVILNMIWRK